MKFSSTWVYAVVLFLMEITMVIGALIILLVLYQNIVRGDFSSIQLVYDDSFISFMETSDFLELSPLGEKYFSDVAFRPVRFEGALYPKEFMPYGMFQFFIQVGIAYTLLIFFYRLIKSAGKFEFFTSKNVRRLRTIGVIFMVWNLFKILNQYFMKYIFETYLLSTELISGRSTIQLMPNFFDSKLFMGLLFLMLAQAFHYGLYLKKEQDLTV